MKKLMIRIWFSLSLSGLLTTVLVSAGFLWAGNHWLHRHQWPPAPQISEIRSNEMATFHNLEYIAHAQQEYGQSDHDLDGRLTYARFLPHLWQSVDTQGNPVPVRLLDKEVSFAMGASLAVDGYYFRNLDSRIISEKGMTRPLDYEQEWALMAVPAQFQKTGHLIFIVDHSSTVFATYDPIIISAYPRQPDADGWTRIDSDQDLQKMQDQHRYLPQKMSFNWK
jgi:hypothetical protein